MATQVFLTNTPSDLQALSNSEYTAWTSRGNAAVSDDDVTTDQGIDGIFCDWIDDVNGGIYWYTPRLSAFTFDGSADTINLRMAESSMLANQGAFIVVESINNTGVYVASHGASSRGVEMGTAEAAQNWTFAFTGSVAEGNRLRIWVATSAVGTGAVGHTCTLWYDGPTAGASGDSYITFTETITEYVPPSWTAAAGAGSFQPASLDEQITDDPRAMAARRPWHRRGRLFVPGAGLFIPRPAVA